MRGLILILLLFVHVQAQQDDGSPVEVLDSGWVTVRMTPAQTQAARTGPARALIPENRNFQRNARRQQSAGALDPNELTIDGRSAALDKINEEARAPAREPMNGYQYTFKLRNAAEMAVQIVFLEYRFTELANPANTVRRQFLCAVKLKPAETQELQTVSALGPSKVISAESLANNQGKIFEEKIQVNRVEFEGGAILQRNDWRLADWKKDVESIVSTPWGKEVCRAF